MMFFALRRWQIKVAMTGSGLLDKLPLHALPATDPESAMHRRNAKADMIRHRVMGLRVLADSLETLVTKYAPRMTDEELTAAAETLMEKLR
jgi:hypothetical protein